MIRQIKISALCSELEQELVKLPYSEDSVRRYKKVFQGFMEYTGDCNYSQSIGTDFLVWEFQQLGGFVTSGEHSKNEMYYFRVIRSLAEYFNFGVLFRRHEFHGEIIWPEPFRKGIEGFLQYTVEYGCSYEHNKRCRSIIKEFVLFLDASGIHEPEGITAGIVDRFVQSMVGLAPATISDRLSSLRQYFRYLYLNEYVSRPIALYLPHAPQRLRVKLPTVWTEEEIERLVHAVDTTNPIGKRDYAMLLLGARLGLRFGDIRNLMLDHIDWNKKEIRILQGKTRQELILPLPNDVRWAIIDYLKNGRPVTECKNVFVVHNAPYTGSPVNSTLRQTLFKALKRADISVDKTKRCGWHTLRHSLATNLLQNGVEVSTISDILGHSDPQVAKHYLRVELSGLRKCPLEVEVMDYVKE